MTKFWTPFPSSCTGNFSNQTSRGKRIAVGRSFWLFTRIPHGMRRFFPISSAASLFTAKPSHERASFRFFMACQEIPLRNERSRPASFAAHLFPTNNVGLFSSVSSSFRDFGAHRLAESELSKSMGSDPSGAHGAAVPQESARFICPTLPAAPAPRSSSPCCPGYSGTAPRGSPRPPAPRRGAHRQTRDGWRHWARKR